METSYLSTLGENGTIMASRWSNPGHFPSVRPSIVHTSCRGTDSEISTLRRRKRRGVISAGDEDASSFGCPSAKKFISEEDVSIHLQQLQLSKHISPTPLVGNNTQVVDGMGVSHYTAEASYYQYPYPTVPTSMTDLGPSWNQRCINAHKQQMVCNKGLNSLEPEYASIHLSAIGDMEDGTTRPSCLNTRRKRHCHTANDIAIRLIPPTPTMVSSALKPSSDDGSQEVLLEDVSEDSSSDNGTSPSVPEVWLAPEIKQVIRESQDDILPAQILQEMNKPCMQLVPYVPHPSLDLKRAVSEFATQQPSLDEYEKCMDSDLRCETSYSAKDGFVESCSGAVRSSKDAGTDTLCLENEFEDEDDMEL